MGPCGHNRCLEPDIFRLGPLHLPLELTSIPVVILTDSIPLTSRRSTFAIILAQSRWACGLSLRDVEEITGISDALVQGIETGEIKDPGFSKVVRLAAAYGLSLPTLARTIPPHKRKE